MTQTLSPDEARRAILRAQGFGRTASDPNPSGRGLVPAVRKLGLLQVDSVNVLARAHYLPLFSRLGPYDRDLLDRQSQRAPRQLFEYWGHEASLIPTRTHRLLRWRMDYGHAWSGPHRVAKEQPGLVEDVRAAVAEFGPVTAAQLEREITGQHPRSRDYSWGWKWSDVKRALEYLFGVGEVSASGRDRTFTRLYDVTERVIPADVLASPTPPRSAAIRGLTDIAARALGVATAADLRDYWRLPAADTRTAVDELLEAASLEPVAVSGWPQTYRHCDAVVPRRDAVTALLSPFDPLIWDRGRMERVFGMRYRIEIYTPAARRQFGYYVMPFLHRGRLVARLDLKADRATGRLLVLGAWSQRALTGEAHPDPQDFAADLAENLKSMAQWLGLREIECTDGRGDLPPLLLGTEQ